MGKQSQFTEEDEEMSGNNRLNGVDVGAVESLIHAIQEKPGRAKSKFRAHNKWVNCGYNKSQISGFYSGEEERSHKHPFELEADEPPVLAGEDKGANPVEHLLHALASCMTTTLVYHAAVRGIKIEEVESDLEGDLDLQGFLGLSDEVRRGYENIRVKFKVKTDAENIERLRALSKLSPVFDVTSKGTKIDVSIERN
jgi:uncharacterized OsmC-like protein